MGQAKLRGSREERVAQARERRAEEERQREARAAERRVELVKHLTEKRVNAPERRAAVVGAGRTMNRSARLALLGALFAFAALAGRRR